MQWLSALVSRLRRRSAAGRPGRYRPAVEGLEDRRVLSHAGPASLPAAPPFTEGRATFEGEPAKFRLDAHGILQSHNAAVGWYYNPTNVARYTLALYANWHQGNASALPRMLENARWLYEDAQPAYAPGVGQFPVYYVPVPIPAYHIAHGFRSALSAGEAIQALYLAGQVSGDARMGRLAHELLQAFAVPYTRGGYLDRLAPQAAWYEEASSPAGPPSRILNGHMFAVIALDWYARQTGDPQAAHLAALGINALRLDLRLYDGRPISYYDLGQHSQQCGYHRGHVVLLRYLYAQTHIEVFRYYALKWGRESC